MYQCVRCAKPILHTINGLCDGCYDIVGCGPARPCPACGWDGPHRHKGACGQCGFISPNFGTSPVEEAMGIRACADRAFFEPFNNSDARAKAGALLGKPTEKDKPAVILSIASRRMFK